MRFQKRIQLIEHHAGHYHGGTRLGVEINHVPQVFADIDDQRVAHRLPALRSAAAAWQYRHASVERDLHGGGGVFLGLRYHHAYRFDLVDGRVSRITPARG